MPIEHGEICEIAEVLIDPALQNRSIRISGRLGSSPLKLLLANHCGNRLTRYDVTQDIATLSSEGHQILVETRLLGPRELKIGAKYHIIGESHKLAQNSKEVCSKIVGPFVGD